MIKEIKSFEIRKIIAVNMVTGEPKATINSVIAGQPKLLKRLSNTVCFELAGKHYWASTKDWKGRKNGFINVA